MADFERNVLEFYQLSTAFPSEWPADKDANDALAEGADPSGQSRRKSRYLALETALNERRSMLSGPDGSGIVQKDEPDPLGSSESVVRSLKSMGLPIKDDPRLRKSWEECAW